MEKLNYDSVGFILRGPGGPRSVDGQNRVLCCFTESEKIVPSQSYRILKS